jgi:3-deoxy-D-manno-octulosonic-acid transferase
VACYSLATCVFVGRSLLPPGGGQNVMEPAALGKPVLVGPHTRNFRSEVKLLVDRGAAAVVEDRRELTAELDRLLSDPRAANRMGQAGRAVIRESQGATERTLARLNPILEGAERRS